MLECSLLSGHETLVPILRFVRYVTYDSIGMAIPACGVIGKWLNPKFRECDLVGVTIRKPLTAVLAIDSFNRTVRSRILSQQL